MSLRLIAMLLISPVICGVALLRPYLGLLGLVIMYYFRPDVLTARAGSGPQMWYTIAVGVGWLMHLKGVKLPPLMLLAFIVVMLCCADCRRSPKGTRTPRRSGAGVVLKLITVMLFTVNLVDTPQKMHWFLWANIDRDGLQPEGDLILSGGGVTERVDVGVGQGGGANYIAMILTMSLPFLYLRVLNAEGLRALVRARACADLRARARPHRFPRRLPGRRRRSALYLLFRSNRKVVGLARARASFAIIVVLVHPRARASSASTRASASKASATGRPRAGSSSGAPRSTMFEEHPSRASESTTSRSSRRATRASSRREGRGQIRARRGRGSGFVAHSTWFQMLAEGGLVIEHSVLPHVPVVAFLTLRGVKKRSRGPARGTGADPAGGRARGGAHRVHGLVDLRKPLQDRLHVVVLRSGRGSRAHLEELRGSQVAPSRAEAA